MLRIKNKVLIFLLFILCNSVNAKPNKFLDGMVNRYKRKRGEF